MPSAVVFAYHNVGVRCLSVLLRHGIDVRLVVSHEDNPTENIWFDSVKELAGKHGIPVITPDDPNTQAFVQRIRDIAPDFIFSFYYRLMLKPALLNIPKHGAFNMHGSLLPKYRGRVPVNWAVINGETETGATLHAMVEKPDAGDIYGQQSVPILPDDTAFEVFEKVTSAAESVLELALPSIVTGAAIGIPQDLSKGSYFGGRKPEDGRIDWNAAAQTIHNLVRGVAPPYPGAFCDLQGKRLRILRTKHVAEKPVDTCPLFGSSSPGIIAVGGNPKKGTSIHAVCGDGAVLTLLEIEVDGETIGYDRFCALFGVQSATQKIPVD